MSKDEVTLNKFGQFMDPCRKLDQEELNIEDVEDNREENFDMDDEDTSPVNLRDFSMEELVSKKGVEL